MMIFCIDNMYKMVIGMLVLFFMGIPVLLSANGHPELIAKGNHEYAQGNYERAYEYYLNAGISDPEVSFKLAWIISHFRNQGLVCEYNAYVDLILEELQYIIEQDSSWLDKILDDTVFVPIQNTVLYNIWKGYDIIKDNSIAKILPQVSWYVIVEPITATDGEIVFRQDGSVFVDWGTYYEYDDEHDEFMPRSFGKQEGSYKISERRIHVKWNRTYDNYYDFDLQKESIYILDLDGVWGILKDAETKQEIFYDMPDECNT